MKKCVHCGTALKDRAVLCVKCGYLQNDDTQVPALPDSAELAFPVIPVEKPVSAACAAPAGRLKTNRGLLKLILLSMITFGIYGIVVMSAVTTDLNVIASRYDGKKTMHYCLMFFLFSWLTLGIAPLVWCHRMCARIGGELERRGIDYRFGAGTYWGWGFFGGLILVGPFIYTHKLLKSMNLLAEHYNIHG